MSRTLALAAVTTLLLMTPALAQPLAAAPQTYDFRDDAAPWINDPNVRLFYQATVDAFANGADHVDREAYLKRSREIFTAFAIAHGMPTDSLLDHVKAIPDEVLAWAARDPHTLDSYDSFVLALFGPQAAPQRGSR